MNYESFISSKTHIKGDHGFNPVYVNDDMFDFQKNLLEWSCRKGRCAVFADCGLGKTLIQLAWARNVVEKTNGRVLVLSPLSVSSQTVSEGEKFGIECEKNRTGSNFKEKIVVTNYEKLHLFDSKDFNGCVCDESSILKNFDGETKKSIVDFMRKMKYRLLCTATAAPNDYIELGNSSEALGVMGYVDMLKTFFKAENGTYAQGGKGMSRYDKNPFDGKFRFKGHSQRDYWRWVVSWARACRKPSDLGFSDNGFDLVDLNVENHVIKAAKPLDGYLFDLPAVGLKEQRQEKRRTIQERCEIAAEIASIDSDPCVSWVHLNDEGDIMTSLIDGAEQISGSDSDDKKEETFNAFRNGDIVKLVTKPVIAGFGLNWQHCAHQTYFPSHSFEQWYQCVRRCWRYGQTKDVKIDVICSEGEVDVLANLRRKSAAAASMFENLVELMNNELKVKTKKTKTEKKGIPQWLIAS